MMKEEVAKRNTPQVVHCNDVVDNLLSDWPAAVYLETKILVAPLSSLQLESHARDQGWGNTGSSRIALQVFDPHTNEVYATSSFIVTHSLKYIKKTYDSDSDVVRATGTGLKIRLIMISAPWPGWECYIESCKILYTYETSPEKLKAREAFINALKEDQNGPWRRSKLMVIGQGRAGKTATVRSLLNKKFDENLESTVGAQLSQIVAKSTNDNAWKEVLDDEIIDYTSQVAAGIAASSLKTLKRKSRPTKSSFLRASAKLRNSIFSKPENQRRSSRKSSLQLLRNENTESLPIRNPESIKIMSTDDALRLRRYENSLYSRIDSLEDESKIAFTIWDYGGQKVFYTLHHLFLTRYGVYLLVVNLIEFLDNQETSTDYIKFWVKSIRLHAPEAPFICVGTFYDKISSRLELESVNQSLLKELKVLSGMVQNEELCFFPLDNTNANGISLIRASIQDSASKEDYVNNKVPLRWMKCLDMVLSQKDLPYLFLDQLSGICKQCRVKHEEVKPMLNLFHELGMVFYLTKTEALSSIVTLNPQWLIDNISKVIRDQALHPFSQEEQIALVEAGLGDDCICLFEQGLVSEDLLEFLWSKEQTAFFLDFMKQTLLLSEWSFTLERLYLIPSMVKPSDGDFMFDTGESVQAYYEFNPGLPTGVFERLICTLVSQISGHHGNAPELSINSAKIYLHDNHAVLIQREGEKMRLITHRLTASKSLNTVTAALQKLKEELFGSNLLYEIHVEGFEKFYPYKEARKVEACKSWFKEIDVYSYESSNINAFLEASTSFNI